MIICCCNALSDKDLKKACVSGVGSAEELYACLGCKPSCGKCLSYVEEAFLQAPEAPARQPE